MKYSGIGGQAVLEGVMMKNGDTYAVAVRKPDHTIEVKKETKKGWAAKHAWTQIPFVRGIFNFIDSMVLGIETLNWSASFYEEEGEKEQPEMTEEQRAAYEKKKKRQDSILMTITTIVSVILALAIFSVLPVWLSNFLKPVVSSVTLLAFLEGVIRLAIFLIYVAVISKMEDIRRVYMYHGAEHKCINCIEHGMELNVENVLKSSRLHKRCGTSFLLIVMVISILFFTVIHVDTLWLRMVSRVLLIPVIAGVSYEFLRLAGRSDNGLVNLLSKPGLWLQHLTTREPDAEIAEVAIASVEAVFDWKTYLAENFGWKESV
ncbi:MAG: DUF1385 domain-containing protein [Lachnospiraceae bacterium]|nr:DUF1385 domain-containing protein [Cuneatibacter sp.]MDD6456267.1 DUF1385 domain-containing protein [Lachnospiraceae bacterium]